MSGFKNTFAKIFRSNNSKNVQFGPETEAEAAANKRKADKDPAIPVNLNKRDELRARIKGDNPSADLSYANAVYSELEGHRPFNASWPKQFKQAVKSKFKSPAKSASKTNPDFPKIAKNVATVGAFRIGPSRGTGNQAFGDRTRAEIQLHNNLVKHIQQTEFELTAEPEPGSLYNTFPPAKEASASQLTAGADRPGEPVDPVPLASPPPGVSATRERAADLASAADASAAIASGAHQSFEPAPMASSFLSPAAAAEPADNIVPPVVEGPSQIRSGFPAAGAQSKTTGNNMSPAAQNGAPHATVLTEAGNGRGGAAARALPDATSSKNGIDPVDAPAGSDDFVGDPVAAAARAADQAETAARDAAQVEQAAHQFLAAAAQARITADEERDLAVALASAAATDQANRAAAAQAQAAAQARQNALAEIKQAARTTALQIAALQQTQREIERQLTSAQATAGNQTVALGRGQSAVEAATLNVASKNRTVEAHGMVYRQLSGQREQSHGNALQALHARRRAEEILRHPEQAAPAPAPAPAPTSSPAHVHSAEVLPDGAGAAPVGTGASQEPRSASGSASYVSADEVFRRRSSAEAGSETGSSVASGHLNRSSARPAGADTSVPDRVRSLENLRRGSSNFNFLNAARADSTQPQDDSPQSAARPSAPAASPFASAAGQSFEEVPSPDRTPTAINAPARQRSRADAAERLQSRPLADLGSESDSEPVAATSDRQRSGKDAPQVASSHPFTDAGPESDSDSDKEILG